MTTTLSNRFKMAGKITLGLFRVDHQRSFFGKVWQLLSRFTWELPQTLVGWLFSLYRAFSGQVSRVDVLGGITYVTKVKSGTVLGVSLGSFINLWILRDQSGKDEDFVFEDHLYMHEFGHVLDSQRLGLAYLFVIGIPSVISASGKGSHRSFWTEIRANRHAKRYFARFPQIEWDENWYPTVKKKK